MNLEANLEVQKVINVLFFKMIDIYNNTWYLLKKS